MPLGGPGPRDWSPPEWSDGASTRRQRGASSGWTAPTVVAAPRSTRPWGYAALSMLLGGGSVVLALLEPQRSGIASGFIASSIGITAIVLGARAVQVGRWTAPISRAFGRGGMILGSVGSALMAYAVVATALLSAGVAALPALSLPIDSSGSQSFVRGLPLPVATDAAAGPTTDDEAPAEAGDSGAQDGSVAADDAAGAPPAAGTVPAPFAVPGLPVIVDRESEAEALMVSTGWLAYAMRDRFSPGTLPETLTVGSSSPQRILLADGTPLTPVPDGTRVLYQVSADRAQFNVTLIGGTYGAVATTSSAVGIVEAS